VRKRLRGSIAYHVAAYPDIIKLDANESPFPLEQSTIHAIAREVLRPDLHRYPDAAARELRQLLAERQGIDIAELMLGNGSDELIGLLCATFAEPRANGQPATVLYPAPSFVVYRIAALAHGMEPVEVPLAPGFAPDEPALLAAVERVRPNLVFLATPNNPTGTVWPRSTVEKLLERHPEVITVVDEAYLAYGDAPSCIDLTRRYPHCLVLQTLSKIGMAALRIGLLIGRRELLAEVEKVRPPYNLGTLSQRAALTLLRDHRAELESHFAEIKRERQRLAEEIAQIAGIEVFPSGANLLLIRVAAAQKLHAALVERGVLVRLFDAGALAGCLRITVGTPAENRALVEALRAASSAF
jgi:histidinol-phosphate aminotransferase